MPIKINTNLTDEQEKILYEEGSKLIGEVYPSKVGEKLTEVVLTAKAGGMVLCQWSV